MVGTKAWLLASIGGASLAGFGFLGQPVQIPLGGVLALTFIPTREITESVKNRINTGENTEEKTDG